MRTIRVITPNPAATRGCFFCEICMKKHITTTNTTIGFIKSPHGSVMNTL
jgi:hypothetical protein